MELTFARWIDDPVYVVSMVRRYICDDFDFDKWRSRLQDTSVEDEQVKSELLGRMPGMKRTIMKMLLRDYVKAGEDREIIRPSWVLATWFLHRITAEAGKRLVTEGVLSAATDVAYVTLYELRDWLGGSGPARQYFNPAHIEHNRRLHKYRMALPDPPFSFVGRPQYPDLAAEAKKDTLVGLGASAGQVRGRVRVILDLEREASAFTAGEILVTKVTDPAWTPLFIEASAVVAETGGLLSHTSIVAREFGIPAIVNVSAVTHVLKTGMEVTVDGTTGRLTIHR
jgi:pyruvate,water dikinase